MKARTSARHKASNQAEQAEALLAASVRDASTSRQLFTAFMLLGGYLAVTAGGVTHLTLFYGTQFNLPVLGTTVPLTAFFIVAPIVFFVVHVWTLIHCALLADTVHALHRDLADKPSFVRAWFIRRQDNFTLIHTISDRENSPFRALLFGITFGSLVVFPLIVMLITQIKFLPYHSAITWEHRCLIFLDLLLLSYFWEIIIDGQDRGFSRWARERLPVHFLGVVLFFPILISDKIFTSRNLFMNSSIRRLNNFFLSGAIWVAILATTIIVTYPGEALSKVLYRNDVASSLGSTAEKILREREIGFQILKLYPSSPVRALIYYYQMEAAPLLSNWIRIKRNLNLGSEVLSPQQRVVIQGKATADTTKDILIADRNLQYASFDNSVLNNVSFVNVNLNDASFQFANIKDVEFSRSWFKRANFDHTNLQDVGFVLSNGSGTDFSHAKFHGVAVTSVRLTGAKFLQTEFNLAQFRGSPPRKGLPGVGYTDLSFSNINTSKIGVLVIENADLSFADVVLGQGTIEGGEFVQIKGVNLEGGSLLINTAAASCLNWYHVGSALLFPKGCNRPLSESRMKEILLSGGENYWLRKPMTTNLTPTLIAAHALLIGLDISTPLAGKEILENGKRESSDEIAKLVGCLAPCEDNSQKNPEYSKQAGRIVQALCDSVKLDYSDLMFQLISLKFGWDEKQQTEYLHKVTQEERDSLRKQFESLLADTSKEFVEDMFLPDFESLTSIAIDRIEGLVRRNGGAKTLGANFDKDLVNGLARCLPKSQAEALVKSVKNSISTVP